MTAAYGSTDPPAEVASALSTLLPKTDDVAQALSLAAEFHSPSMLGHCVRSFALGEQLARMEDLDIDVELLAVAALLHDVALEKVFASRAVAFEVVSGMVCQVFGAGAGWSKDRQMHASQIIIGHVQPFVAVEDDVEGHCLEAATAADIGGSGLERWPQAFCTQLLGAVPRLGLAEEFTSLMTRQAVLVPTSRAAAIASGLGARMRDHPWE